VCTTAVSHARSVGPSRLDVRGSDLSDGEGPCPRVRVWSSTTPVSTNWRASPADGVSTRWSA